GCFRNQQQEVAVMGRRHEAGQELRTGGKALFVEQGPGTEFAGNQHRPQCNEEQQRQRDAAAPGGVVRSKGGRAAHNQKQRGPMLACGSGSKSASAKGEASMVLRYSSVIIASVTCSRFASNTMRPSRKPSRRGKAARASSTWCRLQISVALRVAASRCRTPSVCWASAGSSADSGSSTRKACASETSRRAMLQRWRSPPDRRSTCAYSLSCRLKGTSAS